MSVPASRIGAWADLHYRLAWLYGEDEANRRVASLQSGKCADLIRWRRLGKRK